MMKIKLLFFLVFHGLLFSLSAQSDPDPVDPELPSPDVSGSFCIDPFCGGAEIHPNDNDWTGDNDNKHKIIISTSDTDSDYYTNYQTADRSVQIVVRYPENANNSLVGQSVNFTVTDPDDESPYEPDEQGDDNLDPDNKYGTLSQSSVDLALDPNDPTMVIAQTTLTITDQYSGDNYIVEANLDGWCTQKTSLLVAWKRFYMEYDEMYMTGCFILYSKANDNGTSDDLLFVDHIPMGISEGDMVQVFNQVQNEATTINKIFSGFTNPNTGYDVPSRIRISDITNFSHYEQYWGIRLQNNMTTYNVVTDNLFLNAYGRQGDGTDGGTFLEVRKLNSNHNEKIPNGYYVDEYQITIQPIVGMLGQKRRPLELFLEFCQFWSIGASFKNDNHWHLIAADQADVSVTGVTFRTDVRIGGNNGSYMRRPDLQSNRSLLFNRWHSTVPGPPSPEFEISKQETMAHEFGHIFVKQKNNGITHNHLHGFNNPSSMSHSPNVPSTHLGQDACIMTIDNTLRKRTNQIVEFDNNYPDSANRGHSCHHIIRSTVNPK